MLYHDFLYYNIEGDFPLERVGILKYLPQQTVNCVFIFAANIEQNHLDCGFYLMQYALFIALKLPIIEKKYFLDIPNFKELMKYQFCMACDKENDITLYFPQ